MIHTGDCLDVLKTMPDSSVHCCVTSPPYFGLRDYGVDGQIGLEPTPEAFVSRLVEVFREVLRVLRDDGTLWLNLGDTYNGLKVGSTQENVGAKRHNTSTFRKELDKSIKPKDLIGIPWRVAFALQSDGWYLRQDIIWHKPNPMPESVKDRCTKAHEYLFLLSKSERYHFDAGAIKEPASTAPHRRGGVAGLAACAGPMSRPTSDGGQCGQYAPEEQNRLWGADGTRNRRSVWTVSTRPYKGAHFATFPPKLIEPCVLAGCPAQCCPACGTGYRRLLKDTGERVQQHRAPGTQKAVYSDQGHAKKPSSNSVLDTGFIRVMATVGFAPSCKCGATEPTVPGVVLDPFFGAGTTGLVAMQHGRGYVGIELNPAYVEIAKQRIAAAASGGAG